MTRDSDSATTRSKVVSYLPQHGCRELPVSFATINDIRMPSRATVNNLDLRDRDFLNGFAALMRLDSGQDLVGQVVLSDRNLRRSLVSTTPKPTGHRRSAIFDV